jgi:hypothetical protein
MSDAPIATSFAPPPAAPAAIRDDAAAMGRGVANGLLLSLPLWALIALAVSALF